MRPWLSRHRRRWQPPPCTRRRVNPPRGVRRIATGNPWDKASSTSRRVYATDSQLPGSGGLFSGGLEQNWAPTAAPTVTPTAAPTPQNAQWGEQNWNAPTPPPSSTRRSTDWGLGGLNVNADLNSGSSNWGGAFAGTSPSTTPGVWSNAPNDLSVDIGRPSPTGTTNRRAAQSRHARGRRPNLIDSSLLEPRLARAKCVHFLAVRRPSFPFARPSTSSSAHVDVRASQLSTPRGRDPTGRTSHARASAPPARAFDERIVRPLDTALDLRPVPSSFSSSRLERESHRHHRHRVSMTLSFRRPRFGKVWEQARARRRRRRARG